MTFLVQKRGPKPFRVKAVDAYGEEAIFDSVYDCAKAMKRSVPRIYAALRKGTKVRGVTLSRLPYSESWTLNGGNL